MKVFPTKPVTFNDLELDGKTLDISVGQDGDMIAVIGKDVITGKLYVLKIVERPK